MDTKLRAIATLKRCEVGSKFSYLDGLPKASVLIPLFVRKGQLHMLMTLRSLELRTNAGEVCFPGGKRDPGDKDDVSTALREAEEEIGLIPEQVEVVCTLCPIMNKSGLLVTPVVGFIEDTFCPCPNPSEVSAVFTVPLEFFMKATDHKAYNTPGLLGYLHSFDFLDQNTGNQYQIWGLTAILAILVTVLIFRKNPEYDIGFDSDDPISYFQYSLNRRISKL